MNLICPNCCESLKVIQKLFIEKEDNKFSNAIIKFKCFNKLCKIKNITIEI